ncbi:MAG TPA: carboxymuconolactone decarboxylase family protein, partial [Polyangiaceae bacterium]|nr:carboxymuconolactone decarboxylase family protein [Polyangiaceae bacterium]
MKMLAPWTLSLAVTFASASAFADPPAMEMKGTNTPADAARADIKTTFGFVPGFLNGVPNSALPGAWQEMKSLQMNPNTALPGKLKELIGLAVAAQVPCRYCTYAHTEFAKLDGASDTELGEAVVLASLTRHWSTVLNGIQTDLAKFKTEIGALVARMKAAPKPSAGAKASAPVTDAKGALAEIQQMFGAVPEFFRRFPSEALPGAWTEMRDVQMSSSTALSDKHKSLIGLAVASQIPCAYCVVADTEFAKLAGASEREINEAIAMAALTRHWSTYLNGVQADEVAFKRDVERV